MLRILRGRGVDHRLVRNDTVNTREMLEPSEAAKYRTSSAFYHSGSDHRELRYINRAITPIRPHRLTEQHHQAYYDSYRWVDATLPTNYQQCFDVLEGYEQSILNNVLINALQMQTPEHYYALHTITLWIGAHVFKHAAYCKKEDCNIKSTECAGGTGLQGFMGVYEIEDSHTKRKS